MIFITILILSFLSILFICKNIISKNLNNKKYTILICSVLFLFSFSSLIYYQIGSPFLNMKELYSLRNKILEAKVEQNKNLANDLKKFDELNLASQNDPQNINILLNLAAIASKINKVDFEIATLQKLQLIENSPKIKSLLAQAIVKKANGQVTSRAQKLIDDALADNPSEPGANFLNGLAQSQIGNDEAALKIWMQLYNNTSSDNAWKNDLETNIRIAAKKLGISQRVIDKKLINNVKITDPIANDILNLSEKEQNIRINQMVEQLANRLTKDKKDLDGWIKLFQSYKVLKNNYKALEALRTAIEISPTIFLKQTLLKELLPPNKKPNFTSETVNLIDQILLEDQNNVDALFFKGLKAFNEGDKKIATIYWKKLISILPSNSQMSIELSKKLEK